MSTRILMIVSLLALVFVLIACTGLWLAGRRPPTVQAAPPTADPIVWVNEWKKPPPRLKHLAFASAAMGHKVGISILPPAHDQPAALIIFLHGKGGDETTDLPAFMNFIRPVMRELQLPEPLVVFPNGGLTGYRGNMATLIVDELMPYLDRHYRLLPDSRHRLLAGFSMGGGGAVRLTLQYPQAFGGAASWGGGVWHKDTGLFESVLARADLLHQLDVRLFLANGSNDRPQAFVPLEDVLQRAGVTSQRLEVEGVGHNMGDYFAQTGEPFTDFLRNLWVDRR